MRRCRHCTHLSLGLGYPGLTSWMALFYGCHGEFHLLSCLHSVWELLLVFLWIHSTSPQSSADTLSPQASSFFVSFFAITFGSAHPTQESLPNAVLLSTSSRHTWNDVYFPTLAHNNVFWHFVPLAFSSGSAVGVLSLTHLLTRFYLFNRGEEDSPGRSAEAVGAPGHGRPDRGLGVQPLASRLQEAAAGGGGGWGDAEESRADATLGHTGESVISGRKAACVCKARISAFGHLEKCGNLPVSLMNLNGLRCVRGSFCLHVSEQTWSQTDRDGDTDMEVWQQQYSSLAHECAVHLYHHKSCATRGLQEHKLEDCMMVLDMFLCQ